MSKSHEPGLGRRRPDAAKWGAARCGRRSVAPVEVPGRDVGGEAEAYVAGGRHGATSRCWLP